MDVRVNSCQKESDLLSNLFGEMLSADYDTCFAYYWRGQSDSNWKPQPGLFRRLIEVYPEAEIDQNLIDQYLCDLESDANGLGYYEGGSLATEMRLQHQGAATTLLDITSSPLVALWFAASSNEKVNGSLYRYRIDLCHIYRLNGWNGFKPPYPDNRPGYPIVYVPDKTNERMRAQDAAFLTMKLCGSLKEGNPFLQSVAERFEITKFDVPRGTKKRICSYLDRAYGINGYRLFPDYDGFCKNNSATSYFPRERDELWGKPGKEVLPWHASSDE